jgi:hypothetical protein
MIGRLVVIAEQELSPQSRQALKQLMGSWLAEREVTFVAGLGKAAALAAGSEGGRVFYNRAEHVPLCQMAGLVPWREVWLVAGGRVWKASPFTVENQLREDDLAGLGDGGAGLCWAA